MTVHVPLISDRALKESHNPRADGLGFTSYAKVLAQASIDTTGPFCIGVFGEWGTGKTSLMRLIEHELKDRDDVLPIWYNAWQYEFEEKPILSLLATIDEALKENDKFLAGLKGAGKALHNTVRAAAAGSSSKIGGSLFGLLKAEVGFDGDKAIKRYDELSKSIADQCIFFNTFKSFSSLLSSSRKRIVIFIDDLDRCMPNSIVAVIESLKTVLSMAGVICIIGVSRRNLESYLQHLYNKEYGMNTADSVRYLDKLIQLPFYLPLHDGRMEEFAKSLVEQISDQETREAINSVLQIIVAVCVNNPRSTIRYINNLLIDRAIISSMEGIEGVSFGVFAVARGLQLHWSEIYKLLSESSKCCNELAKWNDDNIFDSADQSVEGVKFVLERMRTDNYLTQLLLSQYGWEWLRMERNREVTVQFLHLRQKTAESGQSEDILDRFPDVIKSEREIGINFPNTKVDFSPDIFADISDIADDDKMRIISSVADDLKSNSIVGYEVIEEVGNTIIYRKVYSTYRRNYVVIFAYFIPQKCINVLKILRLSDYLKSIDFYEKPVPVSDGQ